MVMYVKKRESIGKGGASPHGKRQQVSETTPLRTREFMSNEGGVDRTSVVWMILHRKLRLTLVNWQARPEPFEPSQLIVSGSASEEETHMGQSPVLESHWQKQDRSVWA